MEHVSGAKSQGYLKLGLSAVQTVFLRFGKHAFPNCFIKQEKQHLLLRICSDRTVSRIAGVQTSLWGQMNYSSSFLLPHFKASLCPSPWCRRSSHMGLVPGSQTHLASSTGWCLISSCPFLLLRIRPKRPVLVFSTVRENIAGHHLGQRAPGSTETQVVWHVAWHCCFRLKLRKGDERGGSRKVNFHSA